MANDIQTILKAAGRLKDVETGIQFLIAGDGKERPNLEKTVRREGLDNVRILGAVPKKRVPEVLAAANVCLATLMDIPMFRTTYPNKVFDCMAAGRPIVLGIDGVIREVVEQAGCGVFVRPGDDAALAEAVCKLAGDPSAAARMGERARAFVTEHFDRHQQGKAFAEVLRRVIARG